MFTNLFLFIYLSCYLNSYYYWISGKVKLKIAPILPSLLLSFSAHIFPPCASTTFLEIYNPKPKPSKDFVINFENILGNISDSIPVPVSLTVTNAYDLLLLLMLLVLLLSFFSIETNISPSLVNFIALLKRLEITPLLFLYRLLLIKFL